MRFIRIIVNTCWLLTATSALACAHDALEYAPMPLQFFASDRAVIHARWHDNDTITVESVVSGDLRVGATRPLRAERCESLRNDEQYLFVLFCERNQEDCGHRTAREKFAPDLLKYYAKRHLETFETLRAKAAAWADGSLSSASFREWLSTVGPEHSRENRYLILLLVPRIEELLPWFEHLELKNKVRPEMDAFVAAAMLVPYGTLRDMEDSQPADDDPRVTDYDERVRVLGDAIQNLSMAIRNAAATR